MIYTFLTGLWNSRLRVEMWARVAIMLFITIAAVGDSVWGWVIGVTCWELAGWLVRARQRLMERIR